MLPHTSCRPIHWGRPNPWTLLFFSVFKNAFRTIASDYMLLCDNHSFDVYDFSSVLRCSFDSAFNMSNINVGFCRAGLYPLHPNYFLNMPCPERDEDRPDFVVAKKLRMEMPSGVLLLDFQF